MDTKLRKNVTAREEIGEENVMEVSAWCIDGPWLSPSGEYKNFKKTQ